MSTPITMIITPPPAIVITVDPRVTGVPGQNIELQLAEGYIQWRVVGGTVWTNLLPVTDLIGPPGPVTDVITVTYAEYVLLTPEELEINYYVVRLNQAQYDNLSQEEMDSGNIFIIQP